MFFNKDHNKGSIVKGSSSFFGGTLSIGVGPYTDDAGMSPRDNGIYVIEGWETVERLTTEYGEDWKPVGITYSDLPYVARYDHGGDFSWNSNNYVHGDIDIVARDGDALVFVEVAAWDGASAAFPSSPQLGRGPRQA